jgi:hypothetical protein
LQLKLCNKTDDGLLDIWSSSITDVGDRLTHVSLGVESSKPKLTLPRAEFGRILESAPNMTYLSLSNIVTCNDDGIGELDAGESDDHLIRLLALEHLLIVNYGPIPQVEAPLLTTLSVVSEGDFSLNFSALRTSQLVTLSIDVESNLDGPIAFTEFPEINLSNLETLHLCLQDTNFESSDLGRLQWITRNACNPEALEELSLTFGHTGFTQPPPLELLCGLTTLHIYFTWACGQDHQDIGKELLRWLQETKSLETLTITGTDNALFNHIFFDPLIQGLLQSFNPERPMIRPSLKSLRLQLGNLRWPAMLLTICLQRQRPFGPLVVELGQVDQASDSDIEELQNKWISIRLQGDQPEIIHSFVRESGLGSPGNIEDLLEISSPEERLEYICAELQPAIKHLGR